jgi:hypothetical protein
MSDADLRGALDKALRSSEPGYLGIDSVFPGDALVVYAVAPDDNLLLMRRSYDLAADGSVTLGKGAEEVRPVTRYEPVNAQAAAPCGCGGTSTSGGGEMKEKVKALIACPKTPFTDADVTYLEGLSEERLTALEAHFTALPIDIVDGKVVAKVETKVETKVEVKEPTVEEFLEAHPDIKADVTEARVARENEKTTLVTELKSCQDAYTEDELKAMDVAGLRKLAKVAKKTEAKPDFSGRGAARSATANEEKVEAAPSLESVIKK